MAPASVMLWYAIDCYPVMLYLTFGPYRVASFEIETEINVKLVQKGYTIYEVPITSRARSYREGKKIKVKDFFKILRTLFHYKFRRGD
ncbi:MAG: hypothetical protein NZ958_05160 [Bacteroidia bacterium]|nr:hypothetical protein [Bacteroidia bacterium]MDW8089028.1 hypothetical protein [Bacteroidia bacterium]